MQCRYLQTGTQTNKSYDSGCNNILLVTKMSMNLDNTNYNDDFFYKFFDQWQKCTGICSCMAVMLSVEEK